MYQELIPIILAGHNGLEQCITISLTGMEPAKWHTRVLVLTPCDELVTFDNLLTDKGERVLSFYDGGLLLPLVDPATAAKLNALGKQLCPE